MRNLLARALPYALVGTIAAYFYYAATRIDFHRRGENLGPDAWPKLVLGLLIAVCVYEIVRIALSPRRASGVSGVLEDIVEESVKERGGEDLAVIQTRRPVLLVAGMALTALYVWIIPALGFFLATVPYIALFIALGGYQRWGVNAAVSLLGTLAMMFFFMKLVYVSLPLGQEPFVQVTYFLMRLMGIR